MKSVLIISGWAHGIEAIRPMGDALADAFDVQLITGNQVLKDQKIPDADYIVTGSMGGILAQELLPDSCQKLVLISSTAKFCADEAYACGTHERVLKRMIMQLKRNPVEVLASFYEQVHFPYAVRETDPETSHADLITGLEYLLQSDVRKTVSTIHIPVLLLHGTEDRIIPVGAAQWLDEHLSGSRLSLIEKDGHALPAHHFREVMTEIQSFLIP